MLIDAGSVSAAACRSGAPCGTGAECLHWASLSIAGATAAAQPYAKATLVTLLRPEQENHLLGLSPWVTLLRLEHNTHIPDL